MGSTLKLRIQLRRDTSANWALYDPVLLNGEAAVSSDLNKMKIGDGTSKWSELEYMNGEALAGFSTAEPGAYPVKQDDGSLKWLKPSEFTVEGVQSDLNEIKATLTKIPTSFSIGGQNVTESFDIPIATKDKLGIVKGSQEINISTDGSITINELNVDKLIQTDSLVLKGGDAATN